MKDKKQYNISIDHNKHSTFRYATTYIMLAEQTTREQNEELFRNLFTKCNRSEILSDLHSPVFDKLMWI